MRTSAEPLPSFAVRGLALGNVHRLENLNVAQGRRAVERIASRIGVFTANPSQHLQALRRAGLVTARRNRKTALCRPADAEVDDLLTAMRGLFAPSSPVRDGITTGARLRFWRQILGVVAARAGISTRHLSFLQPGRAQSGRAPARKPAPPRQRRRDA